MSSGGGKEKVKSEKKLPRFVLLHCRSFIFIILAVMTLTCVSACTKTKGLILFNHAPIMKETLLKNSVDFAVGEKIYYIFMYQKQIPSTYVRIQIIKEEEKVGFWSRQPIYSTDHKLYKDQVYYFNDYIVMHESGHYMMAVYLRDNPYKPLANADFFVH